MASVYKGGFISFTLLSVCGGFVVHPDGPNTTPEVDTACGKVQGLWSISGKAYEFRGIPYAEPPVGQRRWTPPVTLSPKDSNCWNGTHVATNFGNACYQRDALNVSKYVGDEDCLYLNVWTPSLNESANLPVMFWIHGGYLLDGNGNQQDIGYAPTAELARETGMVYVSINYRLQAFGFLALEWLTTKSSFNTSGNYGFMDMITGLQWVQENIRSFGGDPNQVTVFGQSSGGTSIYALLGSPLCHNLFHKAWLLSASPVLNKTAADAFKDNELFIKNTNCSDVECLYGLSAHDVTSSIPWDVYPNWQMADLTGLPVKGQFDGAVATIDGYVLREPPFDAWANGRGVDVPVIVGTTAQEVDMLPVPELVGNWTWESDQYQAYVRKTLGTFGDHVAETALKLYPSNVSTPEYQYTTMASDARVICGSDYLTLIASTSFTSPVYRYIATFTPTHPLSLFGVNFPARYAAHGVDIMAFFGSFEKIMPHPGIGEANFKKVVQNEIFSFVKSGRPASAGWKPYPTITALLSENVSFVDAYHAQQCEFWLASGFFAYNWIN